MNLNRLCPKYPSSVIQTSEQFTVYMSDYGQFERHWRFVPVILERLVINSLRNTKVIADIEIRLAPLKNRLKLFLRSKMAFYCERLTCVLLEHVEPFRVFYRGLG